MDLGEIHGMLERELVYPAARAVQAHDALLDRTESDQERVEQMIEALLALDPTDARLQDRVHALHRAIELGVNFVANSKNDRPSAEPWMYGYGSFDAKTKKVVGFHRFENFTGTTWQYGPKMPDPSPKVGVFVGVRLDAFGVGRA